MVTCDQASLFFFSRREKNKGTPDRGLERWLRAFYPYVTLSPQVLPVTILENNQIELPALLSGHNLQLNLELLRRPGIEYNAMPGYSAQPWILSGPPRTPVFLFSKTHGAQRQG